jgi:hypothetical protein
MSDTIPVVTSQARIDALMGGLLSVSGSWSVHLGTSSPTLSWTSQVSDFLDPFYPEYTIGIWTPTPFVVDLAGTVNATGSSVSFAAPSQMPQELTTCWITYTDADGQEQLLEAFYLPDAPVPFGPGGQSYVVNLGFKDQDDS